MGDGDGGFADPTAYPSGELPRYVLAADVNADGSPDVVTSNSRSNTVSVFLNLGDATGTFGPASDFAVGTGPRGIALGELNGDGHLDLVAANLSSTDLTLLSGDGSGGFVPPGTLSLGLGVESVAVGDIDGDGREDLVSRSSELESIAIFYNAGSGNFEPEVRIPVGARPHLFAVTDVDGDGSRDIVSLNQSNEQSLTVIYNRGNRDYVTVPPRMSGQRADAFAIGDVDGDGDLDLPLLFSAKSTVAIYFQNDVQDVGLSRFSYPVGQQEPHGGVVGDYDADGFDDIAIVTGNGKTVQIFYNLGDGTFAGFSSYGVPNGLRTQYLEFRARGEELLDQAKTVDEEFLMSELVLDGGPFGPDFTSDRSCTLATQPLFRIAIDLADGSDDGSTVELFERLQPLDLGGIVTGQAHIVRAEVHLGDEEQVITDYWSLVYSSFKHNLAPTYWVVLASPVTLPELPTPVHAL